jgi:hypothetical protein
MQVGKRSLILGKCRDCHSVLGSPSLLSSVYLLFSLEQREGDHAPPSGADAKNEWSFILTHPYELMVQG